ncbi:SRPBCC family protein [Actinomarinicola tropica]|uniref:Carbon monoxide dehydrogenase n=1 Tax=Actinomarinicola tropica TaxID=2789776 RepID=A0A5Q2RN12_9ACTN|nr:SRPBCC family protein [Actinomarinicola tropica]QGG95971.1 carbon monoxide dehydrogenase [Actinomarinicola tropica]
MELTNDFEVAVPVERAWAVLTDVERIAPCLPGAQLQEVEGDEYRGVVKVKVGPITAQYKGKATFEEKDDENHVAVLKADGRDTRGQGNANARITARLEAAGEGTKVSVHTDLQVTGKVAQFGRGVMADVSAKLLDQFVENLHTTVLAGEEGAEEAPPATAAGSTSAEPAASNAGTTEAAAATATGEAPASNAGPAVDTTPSNVRRIDQPEAKPVDLFDAAGVPVAKRLAPTIGVIVIVLLILRWLRGRGS